MSPQKSGLGRHVGEFRDMQTAQPPAVADTCPLHTAATRSDIEQPEGAAVAHSKSCCRLHWPAYPTIALLGFWYRGQQSTWPLPLLNVVDMPPPLHAQLLSPLTTNTVSVLFNTDIGGVGDFGPVDTERMSKQRDERDIPARVP